MRIAILGLALCTALAAAPQAVHAQKGHDKGKHKGKDHIENVRRNDDRYDRDNRFGLDENGKGPKFCRNGNGHPVHGRQWCVDHGFGPGSDLRWNRASWGDIILRSPRERTLSGIGTGRLGDILGSVILNRLTSHSRELGARSPLTGQWFANQDGQAVLFVRSGSLPVAQLRDVNRDGRVDVVLISGLSTSRPLSSRPHLRRPHRRG